eukprot:45781-Rhodomonas_salina.3
MQEWGNLTLTLTLQGTEAGSFFFNQVLKATAAIPVQTYTATGLFGRPRKVKVEFGLQTKQALFPAFVGADPHSTLTFRGRPNRPVAV